MENANSNEVVNYNKEIDIIDNPNQKSNNCSKRKIIILITSLLIGIIIIAATISNQTHCLVKPGKYEEESSVKDKTFSKTEIEIAEHNTVIKLNNIKFPTSQSNDVYNEEHLYNFCNFTYKFFKNLNYKDFSPIGLYGILINIYMAISDKEQSELLNNILGLSNDERIKFYSKIINNNYFENFYGEND